jgi:hypothetical protein
LKPRSALKHKQLNHNLERFTDYSSRKTRHCNNSSQNTCHTYALVTLCYLSLMHWPHCVYYGVWKSVTTLITYYIWPNADWLNANWPNKFLKSAIRSIGDSVNRRSVNWRFGQPAFGQLAIRSIGVRSICVRSIGCWSIVHDPLLTCGKLSCNKLVTCDELSLLLISNMWRIVAVTNLPWRVVGIPLF